MHSETDAAPDSGAQVQGTSAAVYVVTPSAIEQQIVPDQIDQRRYAFAGPAV
jgi:hypothetical protein